MLDLLKSLAVEWTSASGKLMLSLLPFTSLRATVVYDAFAEVVPREEWKLPHITFANFDTFVMDVKVSKGASPVEKVFGLLWEHRGDPLAERWEMFQALYSDPFFAAFDMAYLATRDHTFDAPPALKAEPAEDALPESGRLTSESATDS